MSNSQKGRRKMEKLKGIIRAIKICIKASCMVIDNNGDGSYDIHCLVDGDKWSEVNKVEEGQ